MNANDPNGKGRGHHMAPAPTQQPQQEAQRRLADAETKFQCAKEDRHEAIYDAVQAAGLTPHQVASFVAMDEEEIALIADVEW